MPAIPTDGQSRRGLIFIALGVVIAVVAVGYALYCTAFSNNARLTHATVVGVEEIHEENLLSNETQGYIWSVEYDLDGETVSTSFYGNATVRYELGQVIPLFYDPADPLTVSEGGDSLWLSALGILCGAVCCAFGAGDIVSARKKERGEPVIWLFR